jgi:hypothetical protein
MDAAAPGNCPRDDTKVGAHLSVAITRAVPFAALIPKKKVHHE